MGGTAMGGAAGGGGGGGGPVGRAGGANPSAGSVSGAEVRGPNQANDPPWLGGGSNIGTRSSSWVSISKRGGAWSRSLDPGRASAATAVAGARTGSPLDGPSCKGQAVWRSRPSRPAQGYGRA